MSSITSLKGNFTGRCFIMGNGPSLLDLTAEEKAALSKETTFVGSRWHRWKEGWTGSFYTLHEPQEIQGEQPERVAQRLHAKASIAKLWVGFQPNPPDWMYVPPPPHLAHNILHHGFRGLWGCEVNHDSHMHHSKELPLASMQLAMWMGFTEIYLLGVDGTDSGHMYDAGDRRPMSMTGILDPWYKLAAAQVPGLKDCTPGGRYNENGVIEYVPLAEALNGV